MSFHGIKRDTIQTLFLSIGIKKEEKIPLSFRVHSSPEKDCKRATIGREKTHIGLPLEDSPRQPHFSEWGKLLFLTQRERMTEQACKESFFFKE